MLDGPARRAKELVLTKAFESMWIKLGVKHRVLYILVPEISLDGASVNAFRGKLVTFCLSM